MQALIIFSLGVLLIVVAVLFFLAFQIMSLKKDLQENIFLKLQSIKAMKNLSSANEIVAEIFSRHYERIQEEELSYDQLDSYNAPVLLDALLKLVENPPVSNPSQILIKLIPTEDNKYKTFIHFKPAKKTEKEAQTAPS